jgi:hypothetical protein
MRDLHDFLFYNPASYKKAYNRSLTQPNWENFIELKLDNNYKKSNLITYYSAPSNWLKGIPFDTTMAKLY